MRKLFGTDGVRGKVNQEPMTPETVLKLGMAAGRHFTRGVHRHTVVIGKDTRLSGYMIGPALVPGFTSVGMDVVLFGPIPTPAVAMLTSSMRADLGVMITASHNPSSDNGIKFFSPDGYKLSDEVEAAIEERMEKTSSFLVPAKQLGRVHRMEDAKGRYIEYVKNTFPHGLRLDGMKIVLDCANGAAYEVAPRVLWELGAEVVKVGVQPDGHNINRGCGATATDFMCEEVVKHGADIGIALDGDADRVIVSDEKGAVVDGDQLLALIANNWKKRGVLKGKGIVATVMSNLGLERYLENNGLELIRTNVGDRYVVERMKQDGCNLGGEQSGHIIFGSRSMIGDGLAAALQICATVVESQKATSEITHLFEPVPQVLENVRMPDRACAMASLESKTVREAIKDGEHRLGNCGRVLIRTSGTEALIRVMAEGDDSELVKSVVSDIVSSIEQSSE
ncbi:MAG: phosphoglucosamine mutase [Alphaproteobacteria bacterium]|nr:phosphoglucosamine mutase [Alphaproteobacteria bacterium]